jgi:mRNA interferase HicA
MANSAAEFTPLGPVLNHVSRARCCSLIGFAPIVPDSIVVAQEKVVSRSVQSPFGAYLLMEQRPDSGVDFIAPVAYRTHLPDYNTSVIYRKHRMDAKELKKWLARQGCVFEGKRGGSGHLVVVNPKNGSRSELPIHSRRELGTGLVRTIKKQLGLEDR